MAFLHSSSDAAAASFPFYSPSSQVSAAETLGRLAAALVPASINHNPEARAKQLLTVLPAALSSGKPVDLVRWISEFSQLDKEARVDWVEVGKLFKTFGYRDQHQLADHRKKTFSYVKPSRQELLAEDIIAASISELQSGRPLKPSRWAMTQQYEGFVSGAARG